MLRRRRRRASGGAGAEGRRRMRWGGTTSAVLAVAVVGWTVVGFVGEMAAVEAQFSEGTPQYEEAFESQQEALLEQLESHEDVAAFVDPLSVLIDNSQYRFLFPEVTDYVLRMIFNPCEGNNYDCCINVFGAPEYGISKLVSDDTLADLSEILNNVDLVLESGAVIDPDESRFADDEKFIADECDGLRDPYPYCAGFRQGLMRPVERPPCIDNNFTVVATDDCFDNDGNSHPYCAQVAYTSTAFAVQCDGDFADDPHCGTFLEIHRADGSPYDDEEFIIAETKIETRNVSGYYSTTIDLTYGINETNKILCNFEELVFREGLMVNVLDTAPSCCCPVEATVNDDGGVLGAYFCPINGFIGGPEAEVLDEESEFIAEETVIAEGQKQCPWLSGDRDVLMCGALDSATNRYFSTECATVELNGTRTYTSSDLVGNEYTDQCPYWPTCALAAATNCTTGDTVHSFVGMTGKITSVPTTEDGTVYGVTFNNGRTSYEFEEDDLELADIPHNYELWWVQRTRSEFVVQKRKGFRVSSPACTFDNNHDRFFPYAIIDDDGNLVE